MVAGSRSNSASVPSKSSSTSGRASCGRACQAAMTRSTPRTEPRIPRFQQLADRDGGVNQSHVCVRLRKIAEEHAGPRLYVFREQSDAVGMRHQPFEQGAGIFEATDHCERLGPPERANRKGARRCAKIIVVTISQHETVLDEQSLVGLYGRDEALVTRIDDAQRRQQQVRRIRKSAVEDLREEPELPVVRTIENFFTVLVGPRLPLERQRVAPEPANQL